MRKPTIEYRDNGEIVIRGVTRCDFKSVLTAAALYAHDRECPEPERRGDWLDEISLWNWRDSWCWGLTQRYIIDSLLEQEMRSDRWFRSDAIKRFMTEWRAKIAEVRAEAAARKAAGQPR